MASSDPLSEMIQEALMEDVLPHLVSISYILDHTGIDQHSPAAMLEMQLQGLTADGQSLLQRLNC